MDQNSSGPQSKETAAPNSRQNETPASQKMTSSFLDGTQGQKAPTQAPIPIIHTRKLSSADPSTSTPMPRRVSIQEPPASIFTPRRVSAQSSSTPSIILPRRLSTQETLPQSLQSSTQDIQSVAYNRWLSSREMASLYHDRRLGILSSHALSSAQSELRSSPMETESHPSTAQSYSLSRKQMRPSVDVPPSITQSPQASVRSFESFVWDSKESSREFSDDSISNHSTLDSSSKLSSISVTMTPTRTQSKCWTLLPVGWRLLLEAKKISRHLSLVLTAAGMVMLSLIALWKPWIHFQVPLVPPGDPAGPQTIPIDTIFFMRCPDISCMNEYDKNAYLLDMAWACLLISGVMSFCVCMGLISTIFFPSTNLPLMDFSLFICSLMTGLFSYLNYINFWSILSLQATWS
ncbi:uncharacterized protein LOC127682520 isoform X2 [Apodemus sylvaticus]|uniref:uncharacterized protein LOC127682520 isoform X2 n=1 Tax=Apodemus sylvaticus TaxID=10129 RepID=UPI0022419E40|nr:uncharacterized protein LOC127682520 isoform X2 [Apodemus sylvaticus]